MPQRSVQKQQRRKPQQRQPHVRQLRKPLHMQAQSLYWHRGRQWPIKQPQRLRSQLQPPMQVVLAVMPRSH